MTLLPSELLLVAGELARILPGRSVQKIVQPDERTVVIGLAGAWLLVSLDRRHGRIHLVEDKPSGSGDAAPASCMLLRKELTGLRFASVEAVVGERALALEFTRGEVRRFLRVFLYGAGARMVLLDESEHVLGVLPQGTPTPPDAVVLPPPRSDERAARFTPSDVSQQIAAHYAHAIVDEAEQKARAEAVGAARRGVEKLLRLEEGLARDLSRLAVASSRRRHADLLLAHLADVPRGAREVVLPDDFGDGEPITIALDPARSAKDNAARLYHEYKRYARGRAALEARLAETRAARARAEATLHAIENASTAELGALSARAPRPKQKGPEAQRREAPRRPYRTFRSTSGSDIFVGKGADKNDELTFHVARGNDLWLHTRDVPGAHVVVPLAGRPIDETTLIDAAMLAVYFSPARPAELRDGAATGSGPTQLAQADVTYVLRKFVKKPRNAAAGRVSVAGGKTLRVRIEPERLRRLLESRLDD